MINHLNLNVGNLFNNNCIFCLAKLYNIKYLSFKKIKEILEYYSKKMVSNLTISGGEFLIRKDWKDIILLAKTLNYTNIGIQTNGRRLTNNKLVKALYNPGVTHYLISLHGHTEKLHSSQTRVKNNFNETITGIVVLVLLQIPEIPPKNFLPM